MLRITKAKYDGSKVRIEYEQQRPDKQYDEFTMSSVDRPTPTFILALNALAADVVKICEFPEDDAKKLTIRGVSVSHTNDIMGVCITALKAVKSAQSPLVLNTPHIPEEPYGDAESPTLTRETLDRVHSFLLEVENYIKGERAQPSLLPSTEEATTVNAWATPVDQGAPESASK